MCVCVCVCVIEREREKEKEKERKWLATNGVSLASVAGTSSALIVSDTMHLLISFGGSFAGPER